MCIRDSTSGFDAFIDGHSHTKMECEWVKDLSGKAVALTQTGSYFANVGEMTIKADGSIATRLISSYEGSDSAVADIQNAWVASVDDMLGEKIAVADTNFYISDPETGKRRIRMAETNLGDFVADGIYSYFNEVEQLHCDICLLYTSHCRAGRAFCPAFRRRRRLCIWKKARSWASGRPFVPSVRWACLLYTSRCV